MRVYAGVEYTVGGLRIRDQQVTNLEGEDGAEDAVASIRPRYLLVKNLERSDWPIEVPLSCAPLWVSRSTYEAGTAVGTLLFSLLSLAAAFTLSYFVQFVGVPSPSMLPALKPGNVVLVTRTLPVGIGRPRVGDVVFFNTPPRLEEVAR